jgi:hypothetical protein
MTAIDREAAGSKEETEKKQPEMIWGETCNIIYQYTIDNLINILMILFLFGTEDKRQVGV